MYDIISPNTEKSIFGDALLKSPTTESECNTIILANATPAIVSDNVADEENITEDSEIFVLEDVKDKPKPLLRLEESTDKYDSISDDSLDKFGKRTQYGNNDYDSIEDRGNKTEDDTDTSLLVLDVKGLSTEQLGNRPDLLNDTSFVDSLNPSPMRKDSLEDSKSIAPEDSDSIDKKGNSKEKYDQMTQDSLTLTDDLSTSDNEQQFSQNSFADKNPMTLIVPEELATDNLPTAIIGESIETIQNSNPFGIGLQQNEDTSAIRLLPETQQPSIEINPFADTITQTASGNINSAPNSLIDFRSVTPELTSKISAMPKEQTTGEIIDTGENITTIVTPIEISVSVSDASSSELSYEIPKVDFSNNQLTDDITSSSYTDEVRNNSNSESLVDLNFDSPKESLIDATTLSLVENSPYESLVLSDVSEVAPRSNHLESKPKWFKSNSFTEHIDEDSNDETENSLLLSEAAAPISTSVSGPSSEVPVQVNKQEDTIPVVPAVTEEMNNNDDKMRLLKSSFDDVQAETEKLDEDCSEEPQITIKETPVKGLDIPSKELPIGDEVPSSPKSYELVMNLMRSNSNKLVAEPDAASDNIPEKSEPLDTLHTDKTQRKGFEKMIPVEIDTPTKVEKIRDAAVVEEATSEISKPVVQDVPKATMEKIQDEPKTIEGKATEDKTISAAAVPAPSNIDEIIQEGQVISRSTPQDQIEVKLPSPLTNTLSKDGLSEPSKVEAKSEQVAEDNMFKGELVEPVGNTPGPLVTPSPQYITDSDSNTSDLEYDAIPPPIPPIPSELINIITNTASAKTECTNN